MNKKWAIIVAIIATLFAGLYFGSPYWAVRNFQAAAKSGDVDALEATVDFPAVRENLKSQLTSALVDKLQNDPEMAENPFAGLGMMMMPAMVNGMVDAFVTPEGIARLAKNGHVQKQADEGETIDKASQPDISYSYSGLDRFRVTMSPKEEANDKRDVGLLFERRGLFGWKMIRVEIPVEAFTEK